MEKTKEIIETQEDECPASIQMIMSDADLSVVGTASSNNKYSSREDTASQLTRWLKNSFSLPKCWPCPLSFIFPSYGPSSPAARIYQVWPGNNVFLFGGRMICGPDPRGLILTIVAVLLADWIFCVYVNDGTAHFGCSTSITSMAVATVVVINLILVGSRDPGIVPRSQLVPPPPQGTGAGSRRRSGRWIAVGSVMVKLKYCRICKIYRPPRSSHCVVCDNCVEKFDHHCPWISQCVGLRNYRNYLMLVLSALVFFVYIFLFTWRSIRRNWVKPHLGLFRMLRDAPETFLLALLSFMAICFLTGIIVLHSYLIALNQKIQTAHERFRTRFAKEPNPYDKGLLKNVKEALITRLPPSSVNFRAGIEADWGCIARALASRTSTSREDIDEHQASCREIVELDSNDIEQNV